MAGMIWGGFFWCCALIFASIGLYSLLLKTPVSIWYRYDIDPERLSDVKTYNQYASIVWFSYAVLFVIDGFIGFAGAYAAGLVFSALLIIPCIPAVNIALKKILLHFTIKQEIEEEESVDSEDTEEETVSGEESSDKPEEEKTEEPVEV